MHLHALSRNIYTPKPHNTPNPKPLTRKPPNPKQKTRGDLQPRMASKWISNSSRPGCLLSLGLGLQGFGCRVHLGTTTPNPAELLGSDSPTCGRDFVSLFLWFFWVEDVVQRIEEVCCRKRRSFRRGDAAPVPHPPFSACRLSLRV